MTCHRVRRRGVALVLVLVLTLVLFTMMKGLVYLAGSTSFKTRGHLERTGALFVVEAGFFDCMNELEKDPTWTAGFNQKPLADVPGRYTVEFNTFGAPFTATQSVNNFNNSSPADSYLGAGTVPADSALLVVQGSYQGRARTVTAIVKRGNPVEVFPGFVASGKIALRGNVNIDGVEDLVTGTPSDGGIYSRQTGNGEPLISWEPKNLGDRAVVESEVGVASVDPSTMDFGPDPTAYTVNRFKTSVTNLTNSVPDILGDIASNTSAPSAGIAPLGTSTVGSGDYYEGGDVSIDGDLILDGATLYIDGNLRVNGTIKGEGAVYVAGDTSFYGDAEIATHASRAVALYSKGDVKLTGFDGTEFINNTLAGNAQAQSWWDQTRATMADVETLMNTADPVDLMGDSNNHGPLGCDLELMRWTLCDYETLLGVTDTWQNRENALVEKLTAEIQAQPQSAARDFVLSRFDELHKLFSIDHKQNPANNGESKQQIANNWISGDRSLHGILDANASNGNVDMMGELMTITKQFDYNKLGTAVFRGVIYTNGFVYASNEVHILGSVHAHDDGSQTPEMIDGREVNPGDMFFDNNTSLTYNQDFSDSAGLTGGSGHLQVQTWIETGP